MSHVDGIDDGVGYGVSGKSSKGGGNGVYGECDNVGVGVYGKSSEGAGLYGESQKSAGMAGRSRDGFGVVGTSGNWAGLYCNSSYDYAAILDGKVKITGNL